MRHTACRLRGPRLIIAESLEKDAVDQAEVQAIVDEVLLPLTAPRQWKS